MMDSKQFGQLALEMLAQVNIPGNALDAALAFRAMAADLADGRAVISEPQKAGNDEHP